MDINTPWQVALVLLMSTPPLIIYWSIRQEVIFRHNLRAVKYIIDLNIPEEEKFKLWKRHNVFVHSILLQWNPFIWTYKQMFKDL